MGFIIDSHLKIVSLTEEKNKHLQSLCYTAIGGDTLNIKLLAGILGTLESYCRVVRHVKVFCGQLSVEKKKINETFHFTKNEAFH